MNLYALLTVCLVQLNKKAVNIEKVAALDVILIVNLVNFMISGSLIIIT